MGRVVGGGVRPPFRGIFANSVGSPRGIGSVISKTLNVSFRKIEQIYIYFFKSVRYGFDKTLKKLGSVFWGSFANLFLKNLLSFLKQFLFQTFLLISILPGFKPFYEFYSTIFWGFNYIMPDEVGISIFFNHQ
jgi:hypothetical protein